MAQDSFEWAKGRLAAVLGLAADDIRRSSRFADDLDADSIDLIEVVNAAEAEFGIEIDEDQLYDIDTVEEFVQLLDDRRAT
ncbi:MAG: acyl carrier protein [Acidimicrobiales bacterium]|nr:acyl carrier protein [Acidimicrobiales bacterium]